MLPPFTRRFTRQSLAALPATSTVISSLLLLLSHPVAGWIGLGWEERQDRRARSFIPGSSRYCPRALHVWTELGLEAEER